MRFFASCPRGLESLLVEDANAVSASDIAEVAGGITFAGDWASAYRLNLESRLATRVLLQVGRSRYLGEDDLYRLAMGIAWGQWFSPEQTIRVFVTAIRSPLKSLEFVTLRIKDGVCDRFRADCGRRPNVDTREPDVRIHAFLTESDCVLYLDTSGEPLYQRGLRQKTVDAPLKENLAAGILRLAGWAPGTTLFDPMCGSGTFLLEAAQMALRMAPGRSRSFAFERFKIFDHDLWKAIRDEASARELPVGETGIVGSDSSPQACRAALANLDRAGLLAAVQLTTADLLEREAPTPAGIMVSNPPYGVRISELEELAAFYPRLGSVLKQRYAGWACCFLTADTRLPKLVGLKPGRKTPLFNGALECRLYRFEMIAGSNRRERPSVQA
jgi:putative N6-adenine-specific DNA methylase